MSRPKRDPNKKIRTSNDLSQFGIIDVPGVMGGDDSDGDDDLEAELMSIIASDKPKPAPRRKPMAPKNTNLDRMVEESMKDIPSDASLSGDEDDPSLLAELRAYTGEAVEAFEENQPPAPETVVTKDFIPVITERINLYKEAEANANSVGDTSKARRIGRGLKTLNELLRKAHAGIAINEEDIPVPISVTAKKPPEILKPVGINFEPSDEHPPEIPPTDPPINQENLISLEPETEDTKKSETDDEEKKKILSLLCERRDQYKRAAVLAKRNGDTEKALAYVKILKQFDAVVSAAEDGQAVDLSTMPPPPPVDENLNKSSDQGNQPNTIRNEYKDSPTVPEVVAPTDDTSASAAPVTVLEALEQRMNKFLEQEEAGRKDGNMSKARRMGRIVKQYQDAIKLHKAGKPFPVDELPTPPGFPPIPVETAPPKPSPAPSPVPPRAATIPSQPSSPLLPQSLSPSVPTSPSVVPPNTEKTSPTPSQKSPLPTRMRHQDFASGSRGTRQEKQMLVLKARQKQYKEAALNAKKNGDIGKAKEYLRISKSFDPLVEATLSGIPVDMTTLPSLPINKENIEKEYEVIKISDCIPGTTSEIYNQLISDLQKQLQMCMETRAHYKAMGEIGSANKFEHLAVSTKKDLDMVKISCNKDEPVPKFHYEKRSFSIVRCNTDLNDNEFELSIVQGINYNVPNPKEIDTYVRFEFPYPNDNPYRDKTPTVYNTNNPEYANIYKIDIQRSNRACQRIFKRQGIKLEVWSKGGFFRSDTLIGTVNMKLQPMETKCTIHDSFDLMDGRKTVGGKLEIKARIRHPIQTKQIEHLDEKWLVID